MGFQEIPVALDELLDRRKVRNNVLLILPIYPHSMNFHIGYVFGFLQFEY